MNKGCYEIPNIVQSLRMDVLCGKITLFEAARTLYATNWIPYVDVEKAKVVLRIKDGERSDGHE